MEKITQYKAIVKAIVSAAARPDDPIFTQTIFDEDSGNYLLMMNGWEGEHRFYACLIHIEVKPDGKIWVHQDNTDLIVVDQLLEKGVPKKDMVLGFHAPIMRGDTEFAVA